MTRLSLAASQRKQVSDFETTLHQNEAKATKAIREAKTHCEAAIREVEACCTTHIREAEAYCTTHIRQAETHCATTITEVEACCATDIREEEPCCADHAHSIQQLHAEGMQCLETEAMEEEGIDHLSFLTACGVALQACPPENMGY